MDITDELIEKLKKDFDGDDSYHSGINDGMYHLKRYLEENKCKHEEKRKVGTNQSQCVSCGTMFVDLEPLI